MQALVPLHLQDIIPAGLWRARPAPTTASIHGSRPPFVSIPHHQEFERYRRSSLISTTFINEFKGGRSLGGRAVKTGARGLHNEAKSELPVIPEIELHRGELEALCREYRVRRLELFG